MKKAKKNSGKPDGIVRSKTRKVRDLSVKSVASAGVKGGLGKKMHLEDISLG